MRIERLFSNSFLILIICACLPVLAYEQLDAISRAKQFLKQQPRWAVQTGLDEGADAIDLSKPTPATVQDLLGKERPHELAGDGTSVGNARFGTAEATLYTLDVDILIYRRQKDTYDYQLIVRQHGSKPDSAEYLLVSIPDPDIVLPASPWRLRIAEARQVFLRRCPPSPFNLTRCFIHAHLTGIGYFGVLPHALNHAVNGIELHPLLNLEFPDDPLQNDPRLKQRVTLSQTASTLAQAVKTMSQMTHIVLAVEGPALSKLPISFRFQETPLQEALVSLSALRNLRWRRKPSGALVLYQWFNPDYAKLMSPRSPEEAAVWDQGKHFIEQYDKLPQETKRRMGEMEFWGVPVNTLPSALQKAVLTLYDKYVRLQQIQPNSLPVPLTRETAAAANLYFRTTLPDALHRGAVTQYALVLALLVDERTTILQIPFSVTLPRSAYETFVPTSGHPATVMSSAAGKSVLQQLARDEDLRLERRITLNKENATMAEVLQALAAQTNLSFVAENWDPLPTKKTVSFEQLPILEILDHLVLIYRFEVSPAPYICLARTNGRYYDSEYHRAEDYIWQQKKRNELKICRKKKLRKCSI